MAEPVKVEQRQDLFERAERLAAGHDLIYGHRGIIGELLDVLRAGEGDVREALVKIANNNWRDQSRAKTVAREALATLAGKDIA